jgi:hypothetical protein
VARAMKMTPEIKKARSKRKRKRQELEETEIEQIKGDTKDAEYQLKLQTKEGHKCNVM